MCGFAMKVIELEIVCLQGVYHLALGVRSKLSNIEALASWEQLLQLIDTEGASDWLIEKASSSNTKKQLE